MPASRDDDSLRTDGPSALHVERRIADDPDVGRVNALADVPLRLEQGPPGDVVAVGQLVREAAEREVVPQTEVAQLDLGAGPDVACEKSDHGFAAFASQRLFYPRQHRPTHLGEHRG